MLRRTLFFVVLALCSQDALPTTLPTVTVVGYRVSGWTTLCEGSGCNAYIRPSTSEPLPGEASLPPEDDRIGIEQVCSPDKSTRENAAWDAYKRMMSAYYSNAYDLRNNDAEIQSNLIPIIMNFSNGSVGSYLRTTAQYTSATGGLIEIQAPNCG
ncbi:hypothetical protein [Rehaibacterium terrae]|uniref:Uncharacterized protein n=1 Tax=Rehaibacterium terrae TaxID=1341696 RepID=A0A7W7V7D7_9GAMM|nr:hypothetical protein [Rehaibacterium terrae]MBB5014503.1 hypothetical protein [Rehaibacterium terrae]